MQIDLELETATPCLAHGATNQILAIRPPAFKGILHYWTRAMLGGVLGATNADGIRQYEEKLLGSTKKQAPLTIRLTEMGSFHPKSVALLPHKSCHREQSRMPTIPAGTKFKLRLQLKFTLTKAEQRAICACFEVALALGAIGQRSRRGFGGLLITASSASDWVAPTPLSKPMAYVQHVATVCRYAQSTLRTIVPPEMHLDQYAAGYTPFPTISQQNGYYKRENTFQSFDSGLHELMTQMHNHHKPAFGSVRGGRQGSPVWFKFLPIQQRYVLVAATFATALRNNAQDMQLVDQVLQNELNMKAFASVPGWNHYVS